MSMMNWDRAKKRTQMARQRHGRPMTLREVPPGRSGLRGVHTGKGRKKWRAVIEINGNRRHLGYFDDAVVAAKAYDAAALEAWGAAAVTNFGARP